MDNLSTTKSSYLKFLPSIYRDTDEEAAVLFERFLKIFEKVLTGIDDEVEIEIEGKKTKVFGISEIIDSIPKYFYPDDDVPIEFVEWLSSWVGLVLKEDWSDGKKREVIAKIIPIYRMRGTKRGIEEFLKIYVDGDVKINDNPRPLQVGINSTVGDTVIGGLPPYFFFVNLNLAVAEFNTRQRKIRTIKEIIDIEKPVHTDYVMTIKAPTIQIGVNSSIGRDTLVGGIFTA